MIDETRHGIGLEDSELRGEVDDMAGAEVDGVQWRRASHCFRHSLGRIGYEGGCVDTVSLGVPASVAPTSSI